MNFAKENKVVLIAGGVALVTLVFALAPIPYCLPSFNDDVRQAMQARYDHINNDIKPKGQTVLHLPGVPDQKGIPSQSWVNAKKRMIDNINAQQVAVEKAAQEGNARGRVDLANAKLPIPILPVPNTTDPLRMAGVKLPGRLPVHVQGDPMDFKTLYGQQFRIWTGLLATGTLTEADDDAAMPPKSEPLKAAWAAKEAARIAALPPAAGGGMGGMNNNGQNTQAERDFYKREVMNRASSLHMYVEAGAFQKRAWFFLNDPPNEQQVFYALVDSWFQSDLVKAILSINNPALASNIKPDAKPDVGKAPIKRLTRVVVGNNARTRFLNTGTVGAAPVAGGVGTTPGDPGPTFLTPTNAQNGTTPGAAVMGPSVAGGNQGIAPAKPGGVQLPATPNGTPDYTLGMTGRSAGQTYDVAYMSVVMDLDPAYFNKFVDALYRQNMGYTVVNVQCRMVDPLDRASNGYLYGDTQVMEVEVLVECILFRSWTAPLMPEAVKTDLGGTPAQ